MHIAHDSLAFYTCSYRLRMQATHQKHSIGRNEQATDFDWFLSGILWNRIEIESTSTIIVIDRRSVVKYQFAYCCHWQWEEFLTNLNRIIAVQSFIIKYFKIIRKSVSRRPNFVENPTENDLLIASQVHLLEFTVRHIIDRIVPTENWWTRNARDINKK